MRGKVFHILADIGAARTLRAAGDLLMPRECIVCGRQLLSSEEHLCIWCRSDLPHTYFWLQSRNAMADKFNLVVQRHIEREDNDHGTLLDGPSHTPYVHAVALFFYRSKTGYRKITQRLKYHADLSAGRAFASELSKKIRACAYLGEIDAVVPVPLHWTRRWSRGYNQAEVIAAELVKGGSGGTMIPDLLKRNRRTRTQTRLSVGQKAENVKGAFSVKRKVAERLVKKAGIGDASRPFHILLVDDVFTTGATLFACWEALRDWNPEVRISIATLGYVG